MLLSSPLLSLLLLANWTLAVEKANDEAPEPRGLNRHEHAAEKRAACNHDNVLRALLANSASATPFCTSFLGVTQSSVQVSAPTPTTTSYVPSFRHLSLPMRDPKGQLPPSPQPQRPFHPPGPHTYYQPTYSHTPPPHVQAAPAPASPFQSKPSLLRDNPQAATPSTPAFSPLRVSKSRPVTLTTQTITQTSTTTIPLTAPCASETVYQGAYKFSSPVTNAYEYNVGPLSQGAFPDTAVTNCCIACNYFAPYRGNSGPSLEGYFGDCIGWRVAADRSCTYFLQGPPGDGYLGSKCNVAGFQPGTLSVNPEAYPLAVGGEGQCASSFTVVQG